MEIGQVNKLKVEKFEKHGVYLYNEAGDRVLLPGKYVPKDLKVDSELDVYVYNDSEDRPVATTERPFIELNGFAVLRAKSVSKHGAFMDWGLPKDLLIPYSEQNKEIEAERSYLCYLKLDYNTNRLVGSTKLTKYLTNEKISVGLDEEVDLLVWTKTDIGTKVIINEMHLGLLYNNEIFTDLKLGQHLKGFIKNIREDNKIDVTLQRSGYSQIEEQSRKVLEILEDFGGYINLNDKSSPEDISKLLGMSKKVFKKAIGALYKDRKIKIEEEGIRLI